MAVVLAGLVGIIAVIDKIYGADISFAGSLIGLVASVAVISAGAVLTYRQGDKKPVSSSHIAELCLFGVFLLCGAAAIYYLLLN